jgi:hypothetical protein
MRRTTRHLLDSRSVPGQESPPGGMVFCCLRELHLVDDDRYRSALLFRSTDDAQLTSNVYRLADSQFGHPKECHKEIDCADRNV